MQLNFISRSISVEVSKFLSKFHFSGQDKDGSKQAFSKARGHIKWEGFVHLNDNFIKDYYSDQDYVHYKNKYLVIASGGTIFQLPYEQALVKEFNQLDTNQGGQAMCMVRSTKFFDVLNHLNVCTTFAAYNDKDGQSKGYSEKELFEECLEKLPQLIDNQQHNIILLGDPYYPSFYYFHQLVALGYNFVFRCRPDFCNEVIAFAQSQEEDAWLEIDLSISLRQYTSTARRIKNRPTHLRVRCVKVLLASGEIEYLVTNLKQEDLTKQDLKELYGIRWNEETSFDTDKNKIEVENFSSKTPNGVRQDFYAKVLTANITQLLIIDAQLQLDEEQQNKNNKHSYQINRAVATGIVKDELPKLLTGQQSVIQWYSRLIKKIVKRREPVRPGRIFPKKRKHNLKFPITKRRLF